MLFLLAMSFIERAISQLAGHKIKQIIARNTEKTIGGILTGAIATAILQSSSLIGLLVLAFVGARVMQLKQALLIIFGANLGGNITPIGSASTLVAVTIMHKNELKVSFGGFVAKAVPYAGVQLLLAVAYVLMFL